MITRAVGLQDASWLIGREQESAKYPWNINNLNESIQAGYDCQIAQAEKQDVGYFVLLHGADTSEILNLVVFKAMQNHGYGTKMLELILLRSRNNGSNALWLEVRESNDIARKLYLGAGFRVSGTRKNYYSGIGGIRENALLMTLSI